MDAALAVIICLTILALGTLLGLGFALGGALVCLVVVLGYALAGLGGALVAGGIAIWLLLAVLRRHAIQAGPAWSPEDPRDD